MSSKPAIVLATGSFCTPDMYEKDVLEPLRSKGYELSAPQLLSAGKKPGPPPTLQDDAALIAREATKFADQGKDVLLVAHSYGGCPASEAVKGLSKAAREKEGKKGGIVRIAYMTALVPDVGEAAPSANDPDATGTFIKIDDDGWMSQPDPSETAKIVFNHQTPEAGLALASQFVQHSAASFGTPLTYAGYADVPTSWLLCEDDLCIKPEFQQKSIDRIEKASGRKVDVTTAFYDHVPNSEHPEEVVAWIERCAEKGGAWE